MSKSRRKLEEEIKEATKEPFTIVIFRSLPVVPKVARKEVLDLNASGELHWSVDYSDDSVDQKMDGSERSSVEQSRFQLSSFPTC